jgi:hypothetical protein
MNMQIMPRLIGLNLGAYPWLWNTTDWILRPPMDTDAKLLPTTIGAAAR